MAVKTGGQQTSVEVCGEKVGSLSQEKGVSDGRTSPRVSLALLQW